MSLAESQVCRALPASAETWLQAMLRIRTLEAILGSRRDAGFQLYSSGEEAVCVGVCEALDPQDQLLSSGRSIGPALARGVAPRALIAEILGRKSGPCSGIAGRGHFCDVSAGFFGAHTVVGGAISTAVGVALAMKMKKVRGVVVTIFGDGACGQGALYESMNVAGLWRLPVLFVCNNNQYAISAPVKAHMHPDPLSRIATPFMPAQTIDGMDVIAVQSAAREIVDRIRDETQPFFLECVSYRFTKHSSGSKESRPQDEIRSWEDRCPIARLEELLIDAGRITRERASRMRQDLEAELRRTVVQVEQEAAPRLADVLRWVEV